MMDYELPERTDFFCSNIDELCQFVASFNQFKNLDSVGCYLVLGAMGDQFLVEIAKGEMTEREIFTTILVTICPEKPFRVAKPLAALSEVHVQLIDFSYFIGLLNLLETLLSTTTKILHPLNNQGDFIHGWSSTKSFISKI